MNLSLTGKERVDFKRFLLYLYFRITLIRALRLAMPFWNHPFGVRNVAPPKVTTSKFEGI